ncbi:MAG TPA: hypothetical protein VLX29_04670 [Nitrospirota bacterium]|nr:hypothetical protein [Nitrospirota bacterium]
MEQEKDNISSWPSLYFSLSHFAQLCKWRGEGRHWDWTGMAAVGVGAVLLSLLFCAISCHTATGTQGEAQQYYRYYCQESKTYYPYVKQCPGGWMKVVPTPTPPKGKE